MSPLVIGGVGGSGTRVYRSIFAAAGYSMLTAPLPVRMHNNEHHDNFMLSRYFYNRWIDRYLDGDLSGIRAAQMKMTTRAWLWVSSPAHYGRGKWGWKNPRSSFLVPFFHSMYPTMAFVHVLRDGRDHAFHPSFPYTKHQQHLLTPEEQRLPDHTRKGLAWARRHDLARAQCEELLPGRHIVSKLEDLCARPEQEIARLLAFVGIEDEGAVQRAARLVRTPVSLGRWKNESPERLAEVESLIGSSLQSYGYQLQSTSVGDS